MERYAEGFRGGGVRAVDGEWVRYDDAQRAVAEAEQRVHAEYRERLRTVYLTGGAMGKRDERARIRAAVEALYASAHRLMSDGHYSYFVPTVEDVLAAIDAGGES